MRIQNQVSLRSILFPLGGILLFVVLVSTTAHAYIPKPRVFYVLARMPGILNHAKPLPLPASKIQTKALQEVVQRQQVAIGQYLQVKRQHFAMMKQRHRVLRKLDQRIISLRRKSASSAEIKQLQKERLQKKRAADKGIGVLEAKENKQRTQLIQLLRRHLLPFSKHSVFAPYTLHYLAELLYELEFIAYLRRSDAYDKALGLYEKGKTPDEPAAPKKSFSQTRAVLSALLKRFKTYPRMAEIYYLMGYCLLEEGKSEGNRYYLQIATLAKSEPKRLQDALFRVGESRYDAGQFAKAAKVYRQALRVPHVHHRYRLLYKLAWSYQKQKLRKKALASFRKVLVFGQSSPKLRRRGIFAESMEYVVKYLVQWSMERPQRLTTWLEQSKLGKQSKRQLLLHLAAYHQKQARTARQLMKTFRPPTTRPRSR